MIIIELYCKKKEVIKIMEIKQLNEFFKKYNNLEIYLGQYYVFGGKLSGNKIEINNQPIINNSKKKSFVGKDIDHLSNIDNSLCDFVTLYNTKTKESLGDGQTGSFYTVDEIKDALLFIISETSKEEFESLNKI